MQHERAPRPLPLFLELVREVAERDPALARDALAGLRAYAGAPRLAAATERPLIAAIAGAALRDHGGDGAAVILVPSLINPPNILDLDRDVSLAAAVAAMGRRCLLLDWGAADARADLSVAGHVEQLLLPLIAALGEAPALVGYCLGGTMAVAAANLSPVSAVVTLAAPWHFRHYPERSRDALKAMWRSAEPPARTLGALPMEVLQAAFWSLDPERTVDKFAAFAKLDPGSDDARRFVELEEWANEGEPLPFAAARELIEDLFGDDRSGAGTWNVGGRAVSDRLNVPALHITALRDRIAPPATAPMGATEGVDSGHVGMVVGSKRRELHRLLGDFLGGAIATPRPAA